MSKVILIIKRDYDYWRYGAITRGDNGKRIFSKEFEFFKGVEEAIKKWDLIFNMKYIYFRKELHKIASKTYLENNFDHIIFYEDDEYMEKMIKDDDIVVPIDEDDWIHPNLANILREVKSDSKVIAWDTKRVEDNRGLKIMFDADSDIHPCVHTAGYAIRGNDSIKIKKHWKVEKKDSYHINKTLGVWVNSVGSTTSLYDHFYCSYSDVKKYMMDDINASFDLPEEFREQWSLYKNLLKELVNSSKI
jgi:hypothetical protein